MSDNEKKLNEVEKNENLNEIEDIEESLINEGNIEEENDDEKSYIESIYERATCSEFVKCLSFIFVVGWLIIVSAILFPYKALDYDDSVNSYNYNRENKQLKINEEYASKYLDSNITMNELDDENMIIKVTLKNKGNEDLKILKSDLAIRRLLCQEKCEFENIKNCICSNVYINLMDDFEGDSFVILKSKKTRVVEYKVPKEITNTDKYEIENHVISLIH